MKPYQIRHRSRGKTLIHGKKYQTAAEAYTMAVGLGLENWEILQVVSRSELTKIIWITRDGRKIPISEMATDHLLNVLNMLYRRYQTKLIRLFEGGFYKIAINTQSDGPAGMFADNGELAGWPAILKEYRARNPRHIPSEWV